MCFFFSPFLSISPLDDVVIVLGTEDRQKFSRRISPLPEDNIENFRSMSLVKFYRLRKVVKFDGIFR